MRGYANNGGVRWPNAIPWGGLALALVWLAACGTSAGLDDAGASSDARADGALPPPDSGISTDAEPGPDAEVGTLVMADCYELQIGVNTDDPDGEGLARWYGSLYPAVQGAVVTNVDVTSVQLTADGVTRGFTEPEVVGQTPFDELPAIQERVRGVVTLTPEELSTCQASGPELHRGVWATTDPVVRLCGTSDQGAWCAEATVDDEDMLRTCHTGVSGMAEGWVNVWENPQPPPAWWTDISFNVTVRHPFDYEPVLATQVVIRGEGSAQSYALNDLPGSSCGGNPALCFNVWYQADGNFDETLCPDWQTGFPPELYITYSGTANGQPFGGAAPAGFCATGNP